MEPSRFNSPINLTSATQASLEGKTAIVTGGASGIGRAAFVVVGDVNEHLGAELSKEFPGVFFQKCNVTDWNDQLALFKAASRVSPSARIDIVVANAGIAKSDAVYAYEGKYDTPLNEPTLLQMQTVSKHCPRPKDQAEPTQPSLDVLDVNLAGTMYTTKLAMHYFRRQYDAESESPSSRQQTCLVFQSSIMGYFDQGGAPLYSASKFAVRGLLRSYRRTAWLHGTRVNCVSPWYVRTPILSQRSIDAMDGSGYGFAEIEDVASAMMHLVTNPEINGRNFLVVPRHLAPGGIITDGGLDEFEEGTLWANLQKGALIATQLLVAQHLKTAQPVVE
ncbi:hypothetical protein ASPCAL02387 [Aspergillus calidoustus]|uniref:Uncharacterized protein n=1 Tax=Aspergillus calidoustus TaxID=454130 RepID=A0A0U5GKG7_ASPCI|nr:hypothetical protein ASPCAL02387 [Aspergillus calidoustus]